MFEDDDLLQEFLLESYESLDQLDRDFVILERSPDDRETLRGIFRSVHTIKGTSGFLAFHKLETLTHVGENLLVRLRDGDLALDQDATSALLQMVDAIRDMLGHIEQSGTDGPEEYAALIERLKALNEADSPSATTPSSAPVAEIAPLANKSLSSSASPKSPSGAGNITDSSIRVDVTQLDRLVNLVGELVLARNQIVQYSSSHTDGGFLSTCQRLNLITTELQEGVMKTRMQPIGNVWRTVPRVVRDLATASGKQIAVVMEGKETEIDKTILESIKDPLTHIVRNSCDHGIETPDVRVAAGKPAEGTLTLRAFHENGLVNIEISDDGGGIDPEKIRAKAVDRGLLSAPGAENYSDRDLIQLIFASGFSTAEAVTNVSGRGVGMDVVRSNIEKIGGTVEIQSTPGTGTSLLVKIPLTLAIIPALIVRVAGERFAIPQVNLLELVRIEEEDLEGAIEYVQGTPVYRLRGDLLPLVYLRDELKLDDPDLLRKKRGRERDRTSTNGGLSAPEGGVNIVVLQAAERTFGLIVEDVNDTEEIVVKPLGPHLKTIRAFAGVTIMGDGCLALILDVLGFAQQANVVREGRTTSGLKTGFVEKPAEEGEMLLLCSAGESRQIAIPLSRVSRLEEIERKRVERAGRRRVAQYRGRIMQLEFLSEIFGAGASPRTEALQVVVCEERERPIGLVVDEVLDVVEHFGAIEPCEDLPGLAGAVVARETVTDVVDVDRLIQQPPRASEARVGP